ncbi:MAG: hypothetical protein ACRDZ3_15215 [Acidimicrobiia bacterium]
MPGDEVVEGMIELSPGSGEWTAVGDVFGEARIESDESGGEDSAVGLGEEDRDAPSEGGELVAVGRRPRGVSW